MKAPVTQPRSCALVEMRIVSLLPSATEILFAIGAGNDVVGVTHECDYPPEALRLPKLTAAAGPDLQTPADIDRHVRAAVHEGSSLYQLDSALLGRLEPDLIVTQELCAVCAVSYEIVSSAVKLLESRHPEPFDSAFGLVQDELRRRTRIVSLEPASLRDVLATMALLGEITCHARGARDLVAALEARIEALKRPDNALRTLVLEWTDPPMSAGHWIPELVELAGGEPILANPGANSQRLEWSAIAQAEPEAVIVAPCGFDLGATQRAIDELDALELWRSLRRTTERSCPCDGRQCVYQPSRTSFGRFGRNYREMVY